MIGVLLAVRAEVRDNSVDQTDPLFSNDWISAFVGIAGAVPGLVTDRAAVAEPNLMASRRD
jgi:hypothetical protein